MLKMVIADDEKLIREVLHKFIDWESLGVSIAAICKDGLEAFHAIEEHKPELVLTDIKMPGMTGLDLAAYFSKRSDYLIEFLFLSGYEEFDFALAAIENGVHHYLVKPLNEDRVVDAVKKACATVRKRQNAGYLLTNTNTPPPVSMHSQCVQQILNYIEQHYPEPELSLKRIAEEQLYMNEDYLGRRFQKECGKRFNQYLTDLRITKSRYLLRHTNKSINEIAESVGYGNNPKYFSSVFHKAIGCSPLHYRRQGI
jgi:YesN/AraC family two-component response regulator